jgi:hypothetical protein
MPINAFLIPSPPDFYLGLQHVHLNKMLAKIYSHSKKKVNQNEEMMIRFLRIRGYTLVTFLSQNFLKNKGEKFTKMEFGGPTSHN